MCERSCWPWDWGFSPRKATGSFKVLPWLLYELLKGLLSVLMSPGISLFLRSSMLMLGSF